MRYGGGKYNSIEELQRVTNLKLENSNLKMKDQLDYAKRQIMVAKENSTRQINAIRRLESKNTSNSQKSDTQAKQNSNETNRTIVESANTISNNLNTALSQIMNSLQSMQTSYSPVDSPSVPQGYNPEADKWTKFWQVYNLAMQSGDPHPMVTAGQWALESGWGSKESGKNNLFGVKGTSGTRKMGYEGSMATFRDYNSPLESVKDHVNLKLNGSNFKNLGYANSGSDEEALRRIASMYVDGTKSAGRFTNDYIKNITNIMETARKQQGNQPSGLRFDKNPTGVDPNLVRLLQDTHSIAVRQGIDLKYLVQVYGEMVLKRILILSKVVLKLMVIRD